MLLLLVRLVWLLAWTIALPWRLLRRWGARTRPGTYLALEIDGAVSELPPPRRRWLQVTLRPRKPELSLHAVREILASAACDPNVRGLVVTLRGLHGGTAKAAAVRSLLTRWREAKKEAVVHLPVGGGMRETYVASAADRVLLAPPAGLSAVGLLAAGRYVRGALDKAGVVPEVIARGRYKTAAERIERTTMSEPQREQVDALLDGVYGEIVGAIATGRHVEPDAARALVDGAPYAGDEAVKAGLVDGLAYDDEVAQQLGKEGKKARLVHLDRWWRPRAALKPGALRSSGVIGVIEIHGAITGEAGLPFRSMAIDERVIAAIRLARLHRQVRGVVLHVDSPGGSALASDRMHHELRALAADKPLVACMGDVAASGGYYVAVAAPTIVARPTTMTGSIGVIGARVVLDPLLSRLGVATEVLSRGAHARLLDPILPLSDEDRAAVEREIEHVYRTFLRVVAEGRRKSVDQVHELAQGRVWTGADALARGLVDQLGGFEDALELVRQRVGRGADRLRVVRVRPRGQPLPPLDPPERKAARVAAAALEAVAQPLGFEPAWLSFRGERVLALDPVAARLRW